jgi:hypothetical protein
MIYTTIFKYEPPRRYWARGWTNREVTAREFMAELRLWCNENLQDGFEITYLFNERIIVNLTDAGDLDLLVLRWGKSGDHS